MIVYKENYLKLKDNYFYRKQLEKKSIENNLLRDHYEKLIKDLIKKSKSTRLFYKNLLFNIQ